LAAATGVLSMSQSLSGSIEILKIWLGLYQIVLPLAS
tara:strand:- start:310 stop:420 length:111 start_codon:yes stop_codon:yes gene_type:complete